MFITHDKFSSKKIRYGFFTKQVPCFKTSRENDLSLAAKSFGSEAIAIVDQKHTNDVLIINDYQSTSIADGQVTNKPGIALGVLTADCVPILLADEEAGVVATVHAGWRGARANIMQRATEQMKSLGAGNITAIIGPCIKQCSYEVGDDLYLNFIYESDGYKKFFIPSIKADHYMFDLPGYVKDRLISAGISKILDIERNTYEEEDCFFSFRRSTHNPSSQMGSLISVIMLVD